MLRKTSEFESIKRSTGLRMKVLLWLRMTVNKARKKKIKSLKRMDECM